MVLFSCFGKDILSLAFSIQILCLFLGTADILILLAVDSAVYGHSFTKAALSSTDYSHKRVAA